jgi:uncharacterized damage-inducible protein DinB
VDKRYLTSQWESVRDGLDTTLDKFADADLDFTPFPGAMRVGELILHLAHEVYGEFHLGIVQDIQAFPAPYPAEEYPSLTRIRAVPESVHPETMAYLGELEEAELERVIVTPWGSSSRQIDLLGHILEHEIHHRGELSLILGMLGRIGLDV